LKLSPPCPYFWCCCSLIPARCYGERKGQHSTIPPCSEWHHISLARGIFEAGPDRSAFGSDQHLDLSGILAALQALYNVFPRAQLVGGMHIGRQQGLFSKLSSSLDSIAFFAFDIRLPYIVHGISAYENQCGNDSFLISVVASFRWTRRTRNQRETERRTRGKCCRVHSRLEIGLENFSEPYSTARGSMAHRHWPSSKEPKTNKTATRLPEKQPWPRIAMDDGTPCRGR
jgi:hypothetical protein